MGGKKRPDVSPGKLRKQYGIKFREERKISLRRPTTLNPIRAWKRMRARRFAEILRKRLGTRNKLAKEIQNFKELTASMRDPDFALRESGEKIIDDAARQEYWADASQDILASVLGLTHYRILLEGEALQRNPGKLKEIEKRNTESRLSMPQISGNIFAEECRELKKMLVKKNELKDHEIFSEPKTFDAVADRTYLDFREMSSLFNNAESAGPRYGGLSHARWYEHYVKSKILPRLAELLTELGREVPDSLA